MELDISVKPAADSDNSYTPPRVTFSVGDEYVSIELESPSRTIKLDREVWKKLNTALA